MDTTKLSFEEIREELKKYLSNQDIFKDYNFTAPGMSVLVDALAYTSHYLIRYANFSINECFLDSAQLRHNVVSQAKQIGYFPYQWKTAKANITVKYVPSSVENWKKSLKDVKIPEGTTFSGENDEGVQFVFRTTKQYDFKQDKTGAWTADIQIVEGTFTEDVFTQDEMYVTKYCLLNDNADLDYLTVRVFESDSDLDGQLWKPAKALVDFGPNAPLYYIQETFDERIEVYFGDGKISKLPEPYNIIKIGYLITHGPEANNIASFKLTSTIDPNFNNGDFQIICPKDEMNLDIGSSGGAEHESIESIKLNAPMYWQAQDRAVTIQDYNALLLNQFGGWLKAVVSWGGETAVPPRYGEVILCCLGRYSEILSPNQKSEIMEYLEAKNLPDIDVVLIDPDPVHVDVRVVADWWKWKTTMVATDMKNKLEKEVRKFFEQYLSSFNVKLKYSSLLMALNAVSDAIDNFLGQRGETAKAYSYSELFSALFCNYLCGGDFLEDLNTRFRSEICLPDGRTPSADVVGDCLKSLAERNVEYAGRSGRVFHFNFATRMNQLLLQCLEATGQLKGGTSIDVDFDHVFLPCEKKDATFSFKRMYGYFPGVLSCNGMILGIVMCDGNNNVRFHQEDLLNHFFRLLEERKVRIHVRRIERIKNGYEKTSQSDPDGINQTEKETRHCRERS